MHACERDLIMQSCAQYSSTYFTMVASLDRSRRCAASTAETIAPSSAERSHISSVTKNFLARLKKAAGPFDALTAMTCLGLSAVCDVSSAVGEVASDDGWSRLLLADDDRADGFPSPSSWLDGVVATVGILVDSAVTCVSVAAGGSSPSFGGVAG